MKKTFLLFAVLFVVAGLRAQTMDLSGLWRFQFDPMGFGMTPGSELYLSRLGGSIALPGSTDQAGLGVRNEASYVDRLSRRFEYCGMAWYQREVVIPSFWSGKDIVLTLERCHWATTVYVDGEQAGADERLSVPNRFSLTSLMTPGVHTLTICVDNRLKYPMDQWAHGTTEYTQTNWNGIVGRIELEARPALNIKQMRIDPDVDNRKIHVRLHLGAGKEAAKGELALQVTGKDGKPVNSVTVPVELPAGGSEISHDVELGKNVRLWDEFDPALYRLTAVLKSELGADTCSSVFGMRKVEQGKHHIRINGHNVHLRGVLDCAVFPITGYPSTSTSDWARIMSTVKSYGMNHVRFHSWCPPRAAFEAADSLGLYLQVELPMWIKDVGRYPQRRDFFEKEMYAILDEYGNHPSFILYCNGNENEGDFAVLEDLVKKGQAYDNRRLYSASTARTHVASDQFYVSHVTDKGWITVYEGKPSTDWDRSKESDIDVPVIAHETGQRCMYPDFREIEKYTGVLEPRNFAVFRERLTRNGMLEQAHDFFRATGAHTVLQYKEVNEALMRTSNSGGFQLLGLSDFPGQGSAFVGILDAFWESKGLVTPEKYRESCGPVVILARLPKRIFSPSETLAARMDVYQFGPTDIRRGNIEWWLADEDGKRIESGRLSHGNIARGGVDSVGVVRVSLDKISQTGKYTLHASLGDVHNEWDIWVYPDNRPVALPENGEQFGAGSGASECRWATTWEQARRLLAQGERVLLVPDVKKVKGRKTHFASHFWNPIMFNWDPMIVGTLISNEHPAFRDFPTSYYADWQWWDILNNARAVDLTDMRTLTPVIQSVDTYEENRKLGIAFEAKVGTGSLFVLNLDIAKELEKRPASCQLLRSVMNYVTSSDFQPQTTLGAYELDALFDMTKDNKSENKGGAAVEQLLNR